MAPVSTSYDERLGVPLRWWALATMFLATVLLAFLVATPVWVAVLGTAVLTGLTVVLFAGYGSARISVHEGLLRAGRAQVPLSALGEPVALDAAQTRRLAGVEADARAYLLLRPYLARSVQVPVEDPADPAPYWLLSSRHPARLAAALTTAGGRLVSPDTRRADGFRLEDLGGLRTRRHHGGLDRGAQGAERDLEALDRQDPAEEPRAPGRVDE
jgi:hypothetical protein